MNAIKLKKKLKIDSFVGADLHDENLGGIDFKGENMSGANLSGANLIDTNLSWANLSRSNLSSAVLINTNLSYVNLFGTNLTGSRIKGANLYAARMYESNLLDARYSISSILFSVHWGELSDELTIECMRLCMLFTGVEKSNDWISSDRCPYGYGRRDILFNEKKSLHGHHIGLPTVNIRELFKRLCEEKKIKINLAD